MQKEENVNYIIVTITNDNEKHLSRIDSGWHSKNEWNRFLALQQVRIYSVECVAKFTEMKCLPSPQKHELTK